MFNPELKTLLSTVGLKNKSHCLVWNGGGVLPLKILKTKKAGEVSKKPSLVIS